MTLGKLVDALPALQKLAAADLTPRTLYRVSKLLSQIDKELAFFNGQRDKILADLGREIEPEKWQIDPPNRDAFAARMADLARVEIDDPPRLVTIPLSERLNLSYNDLMSLQGLIELDGEETA